MERRNDFEIINQTYYEDGGDIHWWIDDDDIIGFLRDWGDEMENGTHLKSTDTRTLRGREYNKWMIGNVFGDHEGDFVDADCPECGHLQVVPNRSEDFFTGAERFCSNHGCEWENEAQKTFIKNQEDDWNKIVNKEPEKKIRLAGEDIFQFVKRVGLELSGQDRYFIKDDNYWTDCIVCKRKVPASDFYIGSGSGFASVLFSHEDCTNGGPSVGVPFKKETREEWGKLIGKLIPIDSPEPPDERA